MFTAFMVDSGHMPESSPYMGSNSTLLQSVSEKGCSGVGGAIPPFPTVSL